MKKKGKIVVVLILITIVISGVFCQFYRVNLGVPREYTRMKYSLGEVVKLENVEIKLNSASKESDKDNSSKDSEKTEGNMYSIELTVKNVGKEDISLSTLYLDSVLVNNIEAAIPVIDHEGPSEEVNYVLKSQEEKNVKMSFNFVKPKEEENFEFYPSKNLYSKEIEKDLKDLKMCQKFIEFNLSK